MKDKGIEGLEKLYNEVLRWVKEPYKLFRHYTVYYFLKLIDQAGHQETCHGIQRSPSSMETP